MRLPDHTTGSVPRAATPLAALSAGLLAAALAAPGATAQAVREPGNVLVVLMDDVGADRVGAYGEHPDAGPTPVIDGLARQGVLFRNAWAQPFCSPTRAAMLTGRAAWRTGIGDIVPGGDAASKPEGDFVPSHREVWLSEALAGTRYRTGAVGKWHLVTDQWQPDPFRHPVLVGGFDVHLGSLRNLVAALGDDYFHWTKNVATGAGVVQVAVDAYVTTENVDDALRLIEAWGDDPWFLWLAFNAPHSPWHEPPPELHTFELDADSPTPVLFRAALQALDTELGRLLDSMAPDVRARTTVLIAGDNGTPPTATTPPVLQGYKGSVFEGGVRVPFIVSGHRVTEPGREVDALVHVQDTYATVLQLAGAPFPGAGVDSVSLVPYLEDPEAAPRRRWILSETFLPNGPAPWKTSRRAVREERYKLIQVTGLLGTTEKFYDVAADPAEQHDLLPTLTPEQAQVHAWLRSVLESQRD
jgi:arylsulfatase A-like enzyme